jgi:vitamin K-dependent gamma-carboxylase
MTATDLRTRLGRPIDASALAAFRIVFGSLLLVAIVRYAAKGMIAQAFVEPRLFFPLHDWLRPLPAPGMHLCFLALGVLAVMLMVGLRARLAAALFCLLFTYAHFVDLTHYLNHYWLVTLLTAILAVIPCAQVWSVDAHLARLAHLRRGTGHHPPPPPATVPVWTLWLLRFQIGCVYLFAGLAKLHGDWLVRGLPLGIWLPARSDAAVIGPLLTHPGTALVMSWAGAAFDLTIVGWLLWRRSRPFAYLAVVAFHLATVPLFRLGMFPWFMMAASLVFLPPGWARRLVRRPLPTALPAAPAVRPIGRPTALALAAYVLVQLALPLRHLAEAGEVRWTERGFRFAWNVMLMEKTGVAELTVRELPSGRERPVPLREHLTPLQVKMMSTQPDLILSFARALAVQERRQGREVAVFADVLVSLNGRPARRLIDPTVDLAARDHRLPDGWILAREDPPESSAAATAAGR